MIRRRTWSADVLAAALAVGVAACTGPEEMTPASPPSAYEVAPSAAWTPTVAPAGRGSRSAAVIAPRPIPVPPAQLIGLDRDSLMAALGAPSFVRRDRPAELWQYGGATCILDLFLYPGADGGAYTVAHVETRPRAGDPVSEHDCVSRLITERAAKAG